MLCSEDVESWQEEFGELKDMARLHYNDRTLDVLLILLLAIGLILSLIYSNCRSRSGAAPPQRPTSPWTGTTPPGSDIDSDGEAGRSAASSSGDKKEMKTLKKAVAPLTNQVEALQK